MMMPTRRRPAASALAVTLLAAVLLAAAPAAGAEAEAPAAATPAPATTPAPAAGEADMGEDVVVTATRSPRAIRDVSAAVTVMPHEVIERSPTKTTDELLRVDPSVTLFRRSSSLAADPSSQGVKLRNVGGTAVSRALVLVDGLPANDPYGGWVPWRAIPRIGLQRVEIVPGGGSALYGNYALGGVIQAFSRPIGSRELDATAEYGAFQTAQVAARGADRWGDLGAALEGELFRSNGYPVVAGYARGPVDGDTPSKHATVSGRAEARARPDLTFDLRSGYFYEDLNGGTRYTTAMVRRLEWAAGAHWAPEGAGKLELSVFGHHGAFGQNRARVSADRSTEALAAHQNVPTDDVGTGLLYRSAPLRLAGTHTLMAGADARWIKGNTLETLYPAPAPPPANPVVERDAYGRQWLVGVFAEELYDWSDALGGSLALRYDRWMNLAASRVEQSLDGTLAESDFAGRSGGQLSPKLGVRARVLEWLSARAAAYRSFRAPTLDELYRPFQVGTIRTDSNPGLTPETLVGGEVGVDLGARRGLSARLTGFWNQLRDPVVNVTTGASTRQRQNLGRARVRGLEADAGWTFLPRWTLGAAYTLADATVTDAPGQPQLVGKQLPQSPRHVATASLAYEDPRLVTASAQLRYLGKQFENDVNTLPMGEALLLDAYVSVRVARPLDLYLAVENLTDKTYLVGRAGVDTVGQPRFVHGGVRVQTGG